MTNILCIVDVHGYSYNWANNIKFYTPTPPMIGDHIILSYMDTYGEEGKLTQKFLITKRHWSIDDANITGVILTCIPIEEL